MMPERDDTARPSGPATILLDRDGVINRLRTDHVKSWKEFEFLPGALCALVDLAEAGWNAIVVTNQSAVGRGLMSRETLDDIHAHMRRAVADAGGRVDALYVCIHAPETGCLCRKPAPGLLLTAAREFSLDIGSTWFVGDNRLDVRAGRAAGARTALVLSGYEKDLSFGADAPDLIASDLRDAVSRLLGSTCRPSTAR